MRRAVVLLVVAAAAVLALAGGMALAASVSCTDAGSAPGDCLGTREPDTITGSAGIDRIAGMEGNDIIDGGASSDEIYGDEGNDTITDASDTGDGDLIYGDQGNDTIDVQEGDEFTDAVNCGPGTKDKVFFDEGFDTVTGCEKKNPQMM